MFNDKFRKMTKNVSADNTKKEIIKVAGVNRR
jgi:hypothetical protein